MAGSCATVQALFREIQLKPEDIGTTFISLGPGSYTGLRVGVMAAKAFAYATGCKLVGVPTFAVLASAALDKHSHVEVIEDAQQGRVYCQRFSIDDAGMPQPEASIQVLEHDAWFAHLDPALTLTGPGLKKKHDCLPSHQLLLPSDFWIPALNSLLRVGLAMQQRNEMADPMTLEPIYARQSSAEVQWTALGR